MGGERRERVGGEERRESGRSEDKEREREGSQYNILRYALPLVVMSMISV